jgi:hypothetical protein
MKKGAILSSKDESGWFGGSCEWLLDEIDEIDENLDENGCRIFISPLFAGDVFIFG